MTFDKVMSWIKQHNRLAAASISIVLFMAAISAWTVSTLENGGKICHLIHLCKEDIKIEVQYKRDVYFPFDQYILTPEAQQATSEIAEIMVDHQDSYLVLQPYTDFYVEDDLNKKYMFIALANRRAETIRTKLNQLGIPLDRIDVRGARVTMQAREPLARVVEASIGPQKE